MVGLDYTYLGEAEDASPVLVGKDSKHRWFYAMVMPTKGVGHPWCVKALVQQLSLAGHRRLVLRSDGEHSIMALKTQVVAELSRDHGVEVVPEESAVGDSQGNGLAEQAAREVKAKVRSLRLQAEELHGRPLRPDHPCLPWMVDFAAMSINIGRRGVDGRTAWELRHGRSCKRARWPYSASG